MSGTPESTEETTKADPEIKVEAAASEEEAPELEPAPDGPPPPPPIKKRSTAPPPAESEAAPVSVSGRLPAANWPPNNLADLMTRQVITLNEKEPIGDLEGWMKRFRFRHLPVVDENKKLVGLISLTDLLHAFLGVSPVGAPIEKASETTLAGSIMRRGVVTGDPNTPLATACRVMIHEKLGCLPIVLEDSTLVGIVTETDFVRLTHELLER